MHPFSPKRRRSCKRAANYLRLAIAITLLCAKHKSSACLEPNGADDSAYIAAGSALQTNLLCLTIWFADKNTHQLAATINTSATYYNQRFALTAAHNFTDRPQYDVAWCEVGTGPNYGTNRGTTARSFKYLIHPGYDPNTTSAGPDLAIICLAASLPGQNAIIGSAATGEIATHAGFGQTATPSIQIFNDRNSRAWTGVVGTAPSSQSPIFYAASSFYPYIPLNGHGLGGDSGGPVFNSQKEIIGLNKAQIGDTAVTGATIFLKLSQPDVLSWIVQNTKNITPNPPLLEVTTSGSLLLTGDTNQIYGIEASTNLQAWQELGLVTNLTGSVMFQEPSAAGFSTRFYRAAAK